MRVVTNRCRKSPTFETKAVYQSKSTSSRCPVTLDYGYLDQISFYICYYSIVLDYRLFSSLLCVELIAAKAYNSCAPSSSSDLEIERVKRTNIDRVSRNASYALL